MRLQRTQTALDYLWEVALLEPAMAWWDAGCSVVPAAQDGSKRPLGDWKNYQTLRAGREDVRGWYHNGQRTGIGLICGKVSGNLEMLELEGRATDSLSIDAIIWECQALGIDNLWFSLVNDGYAEWTPSGGIHFLYRISGHDVPGNTKVARRLATEEELAEHPQDRIKVLAETRGEGGFVIVAPSHGTVHSSGDSWATFAGKVGSIPTITWEQRELLHKAIHRALDAMPEPEVIMPVRQLPSLLNATRPGDDFQMRASWDQILVPHGWRALRMQAGTTYWLRPGKEFQGAQSHSATTGHAGVGADDRLYVFSSSTPFDAETPYNKFHAYAILNYGGDFKAAAKDLASQGFGTPVASNDDARLVLDSARPLSATQAPIAIGEPLMEKVRRDKLGLPMYDDEEFGKDRWDHSGVAENWARIHSGTFAYIPSQKSWMMWQGDKWGTDESLRHERAVDVWCQRMREAGIRQGEGMEKEGKKLCTKAAQTSILGLAKSNPAISASLREFDKDPNLMTVGNGILNLQTGQLTRHDPELMLTRKVNANVDRSKKTGRWTQFMEEVLPDKDIREYLQRACGYALTGTLDERVIFLIHGESGTGKSQFLEAITTVLGDFAAVAPTSTFQPKRNGYDGPSADLHKLRGKRIVLQSELDAGSRLNESLVKSIVGGDTQTTRTLYSDFIEWKPEYTVFMATNFLPRISSTDNAIWTRVKPIKFGQVFINSKGEGGERSLGKKMALTEPEVILNWLLDGLDAYLERGLDEPEQISAWTADYRDDVDTTRQFIAEAPEDGLIEVREGAQMKVRDLYRTYAAWCADNAITPVGTKNFSERMLSAGWKKEKRESGIMWQGVGIASGEWLGAAQRPVVKTWERRT